MSYIYNADDDYLSVRTKDNHHFSLSLRPPVTVIGGDSSTGKTFLCNAMLQPLSTDLV